MCNIEPNTCRFGNNSLTTFVLAKVFVGEIGLLRNNCQKTIEEDDTDKESSKAMWLTIMTMMQERETRRCQLIVLL